MKNNWILRWESVHPFYRIEAFFNGHNKRNILGSDYEKLICVVKKNVVQMYYLEDDLKRKSRQALALFNDNNKISKYIQSTKENYNELINILNNMLQGLQNMPNVEIANQYENMIIKLEALLCSYDLSRPEFFETVEKEIKESLINAGLDTSDLNEIFGLLTTNPELTILDNEEIDRLKIAIESSKIGHIPEKMLVNHQKNYGWIGTSEKDDAWDLEYYKKLIKQEIELGVKIIEEKLNNKIQKKEKLIKKQKEFMNRLNLNQEVINLIYIVKEFAHLRFNIRLKWVHAGYLTKNVFEEISNRCGINKKELEYYKVDEIQSLILDKKKLDSKIIAERERYTFFLDGDNLNLYSGNKSEEVEEKEIEKSDFSDIKELKGNTANPGKVKGFVKIINSLIQDQEKAIEEMKHGEILVTGMTRPHLVQAMQKSGAIITDEGGICCHAAIVSRELGKPCIVGTKIATKVFKDGDFIEVDAENGIVRKIE